MRYSDEVAAYRRAFPDARPNPEIEEGEVVVCPDCGRKFFVSMKTHSIEVIVTNGTAENMPLTICRAALLAVMKGT